VLLLVTSIVVHVVAVSGSQKTWNTLLCLGVGCFLRCRAWLVATTVIQAETIAKKALLDAKDVMRENRKRENSSKNTTNKADKAAAAGAAAVKKKRTR